MDPHSPQLPTVFLHATPDNRMGGHLEHSLSLAQPVWWHTVPRHMGREEECRLPTVKVSLLPVQQDREPDPGTAVAGGAGDAVQTPLQRER